MLLVPYDGRHVPRYHEWMKDPVRTQATTPHPPIFIQHANPVTNTAPNQEIQEATASEPLSLTEEYENQASWRASYDKLTFILCQPLANEAPSTAAAASVTAGEVDAPARMVGDINFFLHPSDSDDDDNAGSNSSGRVVVGEVDIMIAEATDRGKGLGQAAASAFLHWILARRGEILAEYCAGEEDSGAGRRVELGMLMAKIKAGNAGSIALFRGLRFVQEGEVNYFGEVKMVLREFGGLEEVPGGYRVLEYRR